MGHTWGVHKSGALSGCPYDKDPSILGSISRPEFWRSPLGGPWLLAREAISWKARGASLLWTCQLFAL